jgi:hypothetical protein
MKKKKNSYRVRIRMLPKIAPINVAAACAREEVMICNQFSEMNAPKVSPSSANKHIFLLR